MDEAGQHLLAGAGLALDQHVDILAGHLVGQRHQAPHQGGTADLEADRSGYFRPLFPCLISLPQRISLGGGPGDQLLYFADVVKRLLQIFVRPLLHGCHRCFDGAVTGHDDDLAGGLPGLDRLQQGQAVRVGQLQIDHGDAEAGRGKGAHRIRLIGGGGHLIPFFSQQPPEKAADIRFVIDDQYMDW